jgi:hypothetical protein
VKFYRNLLRFIQIFVVLVVLPRVADFVGQLGPNSVGLDFHDVIRYAFAATLGLGTVATSYFSNETQPPEYDDEPTNPRERKRREREAVYYTTMLAAAPYARTAMWLLAVLDGTFNLADATMGAANNGLLNPSLGLLYVVYLVGTILFGLSPTILAIVLSRVNSMVDRIPEDYERPASRKEFDILRTVMGNLGLREYTPENMVAVLPSSARSDRYLPNVTEQEPNEYRTNEPPNSVPKGDQADRITAYLDANTTPDHYPTVSEIRDALAEPKPSKSTISVTRTAWLREYNPWRQVIEHTD